MLRSPRLLAALLGSTLLFAPVALAQQGSTDEEEEEDFEFLKQGDEAAKKKAEAANSGANSFNTYGEEEEDLSNFKLATPPPAETKTEKKAATNPQVGTNRATKLPYDVVGKTALEDNYQAQVVYVDRDAVVIELPVLVARSGSEYDGRGYWIVAEVYADGMKITETRQQVSRPAVATQGPTLAFVKVLVPVPAATGALEVRVGKATAVGAAPTALFKQTVQYNTNG